MVDKLMVTRARGGNRHPLAVGAFILEHLANVQEDYGASMHRAYKEELTRLAGENGRRGPYHKATYMSFQMQVHRLVREGLIEFSGKEEESDNPMFDSKDWKPMRRFYRLK